MCALDLVCVIVCVIVCVFVCVFVVLVFVCVLDLVFVCVATSQLELANVFRLQTCAVNTLSSVTWGGLPCAVDDSRSQHAQPVVHSTHVHVVWGHDVGAHELCRCRMQCSRHHVFS